MTEPGRDERSAERRRRDEQIATESRMPPLKLSPEATAMPMEAHLARQCPRPLAVVGIVENGLVRPLDSTVKLPEHARVIIVASEGG